MHPLGFLFLVFANSHTKLTPTTKVLEGEKRQAFACQAARVRNAVPSPPPTRVCLGRSSKLPNPPLLLTPQYTRHSPPCPG
jgi:hypothetical protein